MKKTIFKKINGAIHPSRIKIIHNWEDPEFIKPVKKKDNPFAVKHGYDKQLTLLYSGNLGQHHDLTTIVKTAEKVKKLPVKFVLIGEGAQKRKLQEYVKEKNLNNVDFHPYQPLEKLPETLTCADVSMVSEDLRATGLCVSCKIYSSLASGQAILAMVDKNSDIAHIVKECNCGIQVKQGDMEEVEEAVKFWLSNPEKLHSMGKNGRKCFEDKFTLKEAIESYAKVLKNI